MNDGISALLLPAQSILVFREEFLAIKIRLREKHQNNYQIDVQLYRERSLLANEFFKTHSSC
ncbi:MAG: hypothetical protein BA873_13370 [Desulfobulbaceae bacterium C00003063]|nr:MAG: hypothetical protein BA873_13370 [Desulfobulbaceae bacterium C00003063]